MKFPKQQYSYFVFTVFLMIVCLSMLTIYSGYRHESMKIRSITVHALLVILGLFLVGDTFKFLVLSFDAAFFPRQENKYQMEKNPTIHKKIDYLKMRLKTLKSQLLVTEDHLHEFINLKYQIIATDLWLYGTYFILLMLLVLVTQDSLMLTNTNTMEKLFAKNQSLSIGLTSVSEFEQVYQFIVSALINPFNPLPNETGSKTWVYGDSTSKLGVVRLRILRVKDDYHLGWGEPKFSSLEYLPKWELPYKRMAYTDKYWHIYQPWLPSSVTYTQFERTFLDFKHFGYFQEYPEFAGYITLLARTRKNSQKILNYLRKNNWASKESAVLFMDLTLYNTDSNIFSVCTLLLEQTPFGTIYPKVNVLSVKMQVLDHLGTIGFIVAVVYVVIVILFSKTLVVTIWYEPSKLRNTWNRVDLIILILNLFVVACIIMQEAMVVSLLARVEYASELEFLDFRQPARVHFLSHIMMGFLVCLTTLRLWKVLQFANVFQLFTTALFAAWPALASTGLIIMIFLFAFGMAVATINGNNSVNFTDIMRSIITSLCFSFGFSSHVSPQDLFHGGIALGLILYLLLTFVLAQLLINFFVSTVHEYFKCTKSLRDSRSVRTINFLQFLRIEYAFIFNIFLMLSFCKRSYHRRNRTVAENIKISLDQKQRSGIKNRHHAFSTSRYKSDEKVDETKKHAEYIRRIGRVYTVASIMQTQMLLLEHMYFSERDELFDKNSSEHDDDEFLV